MNIRFVTRRVHAWIDYPVAISLLVMPFVLDLGATDPLAKGLSVVVGAAAFVLTVLTNHETGLIKVLPYWFHVAVDRLVGVTFVAAPFVLGFTGLDAWYYWANAAAVLTATVLLAAPGATTPQPLSRSALATAAA
jgi:hypothetical protein